jgi:hypothetical protein
MTMLNHSSQLKAFLNVTAAVAYLVASVAAEDLAATTEPLTDYATTTTAPPVSLTKPVVDTGIP